MDLLNTVPLKVLPLYNCLLEKSYGERHIDKPLSCTVTHSETGSWIRM
jgi:hypothetical protein